MRRSKSAQLDFSAGRQAEAERRLAEVLRQNPRSAEGLILQGKMALIGETARMPCRLSHSASGSAGIRPCAYLLGQAYLMTGDSQLARESFERAVALQPDAVVEPNLALAILESQSGQFATSQGAPEGNSKVSSGYISKRWSGSLPWTLGQAIGPMPRATLDHLRRRGSDNTRTSDGGGPLYEAKRTSPRATVAFERAAAMARCAGTLVGVVRSISIRSRWSARGAAWKPW
jgi:tetratricopeptide (TPR) repeat protein